MISAEDMKIIQNGEMLSDTIVWKSSELLKSQLPHIMGLAHPIPREDVLTRWAKCGEEHCTYVPSTKKAPYLQIINTGHEHWITCYKPKSKSCVLAEVKFCISLQSLHFLYIFFVPSFIFTDKEGEICILNSSGSTNFGSFVEQQLALIINTDERTFKVIHSHVKEQSDNSNDCGLLAIAFATELAFTEQLMYVDFNSLELRPHLIKCLNEKKMKPFPRGGLPLPSKRLEVASIEVCCFCRLPPHFDVTTIFCMRCRIWCHLRCNGLTCKPPGRHWECNACKPK